MAPSNFMNYTYSTYSIDALRQDVRSNQRRQRRLDIGRRADGAGRDVAIDAPGKTGQHLARTDFIERRSRRSPRTTRPSRASEPDRSPARPSAVRSHPDRSAASPRHWRRRAPTDDAWRRLPAPRAWRRRPAPSSAEWKGAETVSISARLAPFSVQSLAASSTAGLAPEMTSCPPPLSLAIWHTEPAPGFRASRFNVGMVEADDRSHRALAHRHGFLHRIAANAQQPCGVGDREGTGGG